MYFEVYVNLQKPSILACVGSRNVFVREAGSFLHRSSVSLLCLASLCFYLTSLSFCFFLTVHVGSPLTKFHDQELEHSGVFLFLLFRDVHVSVKLALREDVVLNSSVEMQLWSRKNSCSLCICQMNWRC